MQATYASSLPGLSHRAQGYDASIDCLTPPAVLQFLADWLAQGLSPRSVARTLAALRAFDQWLVQQGLRPTRLLWDMRTPHIPRALPPFLSQQDMERLLRQPARTTPMGLRDVAMLEVLYGSGLRVSELVTLPMSALHLAGGWLKVHGKGGHERVAPMGEPAIVALQVYLAEPRAALLKGRANPYVFISTRGQHPWAADD
jgi:integrase/recombinase XerD